MAPSFGPGSLARHARRAAAAGATVRVAALRSLELDVDTPGDLAALRDALRELPAAAAPRTRALLAQLAGPSRERPRRGAARAAGDRRGRRPRRAAGRGRRAAAGDRADRRRRARRRPQGGGQGGGARDRARRRRSGRAGARAAAQHGKDPRLVAPFLADTPGLLRADTGRLHLAHPARLLCANAGVDHPTPAGPSAPCCSPATRIPLARALRAAPRLRGPGRRLVRPGVAHRSGRGRDRLRGDRALDDLRGRPDAGGRDSTRRRSRSPTRRRRPPTCHGARRRASPRCGSAASGASCSTHDGPGAAALVRARDQDLFG